jgi:hypothetical protein
MLILFVALSHGSHFTTFLTGQTAADFRAKPRFRANAAGVGDYIPISAHMTRKKRHFFTTMHHFCLTFCM